MPFLVALSRFLRGTHPLVARTHTSIRLFAVQCALSLGCATFVLSNKTPLSIKITKHENTEKILVSLQLLQMDWDLHR